MCCPAARFNLDQLAKSVSAVQKTITDKKKKGEDAAAEIAEAEKLREGKPALEKAEQAAKAALDAALHKIGNIVHQSVPVSKDEVRSHSLQGYKRAHLLIFREWLFFPSTTCISPNLRSFFFSGDMMITCTSV